MPLQRTADVTGSLACDIAPILKHSILLSFSKSYRRLGKIDQSYFDRPILAGRQSEIS